MQKGAAFMSVGATVSAWVCVSIGSVCLCKYMDVFEELYQKDS